MLNSCLKITCLKDNDVVELKHKNYPEIIITITDSNLGYINPLQPNHIIYPFTKIILVFIFLPFRL